MQTVSRDKLAEAVIKGGNSLYEVYNKAAQTAKAQDGQQKQNEIGPEALKPQKGAQGLAPGKK